MIESKRKLWIDPNGNDPPCFLSRKECLTPPVYACLKLVFGHCLASVKIPPDLVLTAFLYHLSNAIHKITTRHLSFLSSCTIGTVRYSRAERLVLSSGRTWTWYLNLTGVSLGKVCNPMRIFAPFGLLCRSQSVVWVKGINRCASCYGTLVGHGHAYSY